MADVNRSGARIDTDQAEARQAEGNWLSENQVGTLDLSQPTTATAREWIKVAVSRHRPHGTAPAPDATVTMRHHTGERYRAWQLSRAEALDLVALLLVATRQAEMQPMAPQCDTSHESMTLKGRTCRITNESLTTTGLIKTC